MPKWEYRIEKINILGCYLVDEEYCPIDKRIHASWNTIDNLGDDGWEMISAGGWDGDEGIAVFKREQGYIHPDRVEIGEDALTKDGEPAQARRGLDAMKKRFQNG